MNAEDAVIAAIDELERDEIDELVDWQLAESPAAQAETERGWDFIPADVWARGDSYECEIDHAGRVSVTVLDGGYPIWASRPAADRWY